MLLSLRRVLATQGASSSAASFSCSRAASSTSTSTATGVNYFKTGEDPPLKEDSEYPEWLWSIADPPSSLFTLERKYSEDETVNDDNFTDMKRLVKLQNIRDIKDLNEIKAKK
ncbi:g8179 [Coccomyxa viridis]|uniref:Large ribosomal subunit protein mL54 n=1 Tax=Coccomyxa viridis TaxID=1274662 RepID=A0ABP1G287_9CHLO